MMGRDQTGCAVLQLLREHEETSSIPVILCSAAEPALRKYAATATGTVPVEAVSKPFDVDHLLEVISRLLAHSRADANPA